MGALALEEMVDAKVALMNLGPKMVIAIYLETQVGKMLLPTTRATRREDLGLVLVAHLGLAPAEPPVSLV